MSKQGLYYKLVETQLQGVPSNNANDRKEPTDCLPNDGSTADSHSLLHLKIDRKDLGADRIENQSRDNKEVAESDISIWKLLHLNKDEWKYTTLGVIGSAIVGLSAPVYGILFRELMGLLDPTLIQEDAQRLNDLFALVLYNIN